jgi:hypothetical protein
MIKILRTKLRKKKKPWWPISNSQDKVIFSPHVFEFFFLYKIPFYLYFNLQEIKLKVSKNKIKRNKFISRPHHDKNKLFFMLMSFILW